MKKEGVLFANRDGVDNETKYGGLTLGNQLIDNPKNEQQILMLEDLNKKYNLNVLTFQTGLLLYDTNIITNNN